MTILSWNVNGLRAVLRKGFPDFLKKEKPDVLCLQEIKIDAEAIKQAEFDFPGYEEFYNPAERKGYSGTAILVKDVIARSVATKQSRKSQKKLEIKAEASRTGLPRGFAARNDMLLPKLKWDDEGRIQMLDLGKFYLANVYFPNANHELSRLDFKINEFNHKLLLYLKKLDKTKPVVICGDYNVAHEEIDLARPKENVGNPGFTDEERAWMTKFLKAGFVDTFRAQNPDKVQYSWWSYRMNARAKNVGWRIDYFCVSQRFRKNIKNSFILDKIQGSDHAPVGVIIK